LIYFVLGLCFSTRSLLRRTDQSEYVSIKSITTYYQEKEKKKKNAKYKKKANRKSFAKKKIRRNGTNKSDQIPLNTFRDFF